MGKLVCRMNITQAKENLINQGIDIKKIDWESYSDDIPIENYVHLEKDLQLYLTFSMKHYNDLI